MSVAERRERDRQARFDLILNSARDLFIEKGFDNVSMADIAAKAEVAKGTVYIYFQSKQEILYSILEPILIRYHKGLDDLAKVDEPADQTLKKMIDYMFEFYLREPDCHHLVARYEEHEFKKLLSPEKLKRLKTIMRNNLLVVAKVVERGVKQGIFKNIDPWVFSIIYWNTFNSNVKFQENRIAAGGKDYRKSTVDMALSLIMEGLMCR
jgi:TetR/AcrR family transcriptional regulator